VFCDIMIVRLTKLRVIKKAIAIDGKQLNI